MAEETIVAAPPVVETPAAAPPAAPPPAAEPAAPQKWNFDLGDGEKYEYEDQPETTPESDKGLDVSKQFDASIEEKLKDAPEQLKGVKNLWHESRRWRQQGFKNPEELKAHNEKLNEISTSLGRTDGLKGLAAIEAETKEWHEVQQGFRTGDPAVVKSWSEMSPEGFNTLMPHALEQWRTANPMEAAREMAETFVQTITYADPQGRTFLNAFNEAFKAIPETDKNTRALMQYMADELNKIIKISTTKKEGSSDRRSVTTEQQKIQVQQRQVYLGKLDNMTRPVEDRVVDQALTQALSGKKVSDELREELKDDLKREWRTWSQKNKDYNQNARQILEAKDDDRFMRLFKSHITRNIAPIARKLVRKYVSLGGGNAERKAEGAARIESAAGGTGKAEGAVIKYSGPMIAGGPDPSQIDYPAMRAKFGRDGMTEQLSNHRFIKKGDPKNTYVW